MSENSSNVTLTTTIGIDLGDRLSEVCILDNVSGDVLERFRVQTTRASFEVRFAKFPLARVVIEAGAQSPWASRSLAKLGHRVIVANPRNVKLIGHSIRKTDRADAETLARLGRADERLLHPIEHRDERTQQHMGVLRARDQVVRARTAMINHVRGRSKAMGTRLSGASGPAFPDKASAELPRGLRTALAPVLALIRQMNKTIRKFDEEVAKLCVKDHPETALLQQISGVGPVTSLAFVLVIGDAQRFCPVTPGARQF